MRHCVVFQCQCHRADQDVASPTRPIPRIEGTSDGLVLLKSFRSLTSDRDAVGAQGERLERRADALGNLPRGIDRRHFAALDRIDEAAILGGAQVGVPG